MRAVAKPWHLVHLTIYIYICIILTSICIYVSSRKPADSLAHGPPTGIFAHCLATCSRQSPLTSLGAPFFTSKRRLSQDEKGYPPKPMYLLSFSIPYRGGCDVNFTPSRCSLPDVSQSCDPARQVPEFLAPFQLQTALESSEKRAPP